MPRLPKHGAKAAPQPPRETSSESSMSDEEDARELQAYMELMADRNGAADARESSEPEARRTIDNEAALEARLDEIRLDQPPAGADAGVEWELPWIETMAVETEPEVALTAEDAQNDLKRELCFAAQGLAAARAARELCAASNVPFFRPSDFFAEMVKTDQQMARIRHELLREAKSVKAAEEAKKNRHAKKFSKQVNKVKRAEREKFERAFSSLQSHRKARAGANGKSSGRDRDRDGDGAGGRSGKPAHRSAGKAGRAGKAGGAGRGGKAGRAGKAGGRGSDKGRRR